MIDSDTTGNFRQSWPDSRDGSVFFLWFADDSRTAPSLVAYSPCKSSVAISVNERQDDEDKDADTGIARS